MGQGAIRWLKITLVTIVHNKNHEHVYWQCDSNTSVSVAFGHFLQGQYYFRFSFHISFFKNTCFWKPTFPRCAVCSLLCMQSHVYMRKYTPIPEHTQAAFHVTYLPTPLVIHMFGHGKCWDATFQTLQIFLVTSSHLSLHTGFSNVTYGGGCLA